MLLLSGKNLNQLKRLNAREHLAIITAGLFLCLHFATWITSLRFTSIASSVIIVDSSPLFVVLFSRLFLREKTSRNELFGIVLSIFGAAAGNLALTGLTRGGIYIGGGIAPKILPKLQEGLFMKTFADKGRFEGLLHEIPLRVILNDKAALLGAAYRALEVER